MRRSRFRLIQTECCRCRAVLYTGSRSLFGMDALKARLDRICAKCMTPEEHKLIDETFRKGAC